MSREQGRQRFQRAVTVLATEKDRIKERLLVAYASQLAGIHPETDLPEPMVAKFDRLRYRLSEADIPYGYGEHAAQKIKHMSEDDAATVAGEIVNMYLELPGADGG